MQLEGGVGEGTEDLLPLQHVDVPQAQGEGERGLGSNRELVSLNRIVFGQELDHAIPSSI